MNVDLITGDARTMLATLPDKSIQCCVTSPPYYGLRSYLPKDHPDKIKEHGTEATPDTFIAELVAVFRDVRRVLRDDGTVWIVLGDGFKDKQLMMIPARVAIALQEDGWVLRKDIIWSKPNPMTESVLDRPTTSHEHVILLTKKLAYFYDAEAVREPDAGTDHPRNGWSPVDRSGGHLGEDKGIRTKEGRNGLGRNLRDVWKIATAPFPGSHFAVYPRKLVEICIKAGTSEKGCCLICRAPWKRVILKGKPDLAHRTACGADSSGGYSGQAVKNYATAGAQNASDVKRRILEGMREKTYVWRQTCDCLPADPVPCAVLDPFGGAGTTAIAAIDLGRDAVLIDLNPAFSDMAHDRIKKHLEKTQNNCCVIARKPLKLEIVQPKAKLMQVTVTVNTHPSTSAIAIQQWMDWALRIEAGSAEQPQPAEAKPNGKTPAAVSEKEQALFNQLVATKKETAPPPQPVVEIAATTDETDGEETDETEAETAPQTGAVPPGITAPPKRKGGRPSKAMIAEREAAAAAAAAAVNPAMPGTPQPPATPAAAPSNGAMPLNVSTGARPPGVVSAPVQQLQQPAMPPQEEFSDGTTTKADVQGCYTAAASHDPKGVRALLQSSTWPDGTQKPRWFTIDMVVPTFYDRLFNELGALIPAEG